LPKRCRGSCAWVPGSRLRRAPERPHSLDDHLVEVAPFRVLLFNEPDLPIAPPFLEFLLAADRGCRIIIDLKPDEAIDGVSFREPRDNFGFVLIDSADEITAHSEVQGPVTAAGEEIYEKTGHSGTAL
jgi:hypothetical protein